jgi:hypothetical protein
MRDGKVVVLGIFRILSRIGRPLKRAHLAIGQPNSWIDLREAATLERPGIPTT